MVYDMPLRMRNKIQKYDWGSKTAIPSILNLSIFNNKPMAELWMGAHQKAPSEVQVNGKWIYLDKLITKDPISILGKRVVDKFSKELPFLFKIIAAEKPLSVQVHPNKEQAEIGFEKESKLGIPLDAPNRNYKDKNHKPEILCAVTRFEALKGFRDIEEIILLLSNVVPSVLKNDFDVFKRKSDSQGLKEFYKSIMNMDPQKKIIAIEELIKNVQGYVDKDPVYSLILRLNKIFPGDIGIFSALLLNRVVIGAGEAIYIPTGELHAYIEGVGIELMANSDNVLRGGLTTKYVDIEELLNIVNFDYGPAQIITPINGKYCEFIYPTPVEEFVLSVIKLKNGETFLSSMHRSVEIMFVMQGKATIQNMKKGNKLALKQGDSILIPSAMPQYKIYGNATIYKASVPIWIQ